MGKQIVIYTIGHSDHSTTDLTALLKRHQVGRVIDVRSQPYSRWTHQFNRETLAYNLEASGLTYHFMGDVLGGRPKDPALYDPGQERPDYQRVEQTPTYQAGIHELLQLAQAERIVLMCSEGDYTSCHRHLLITQTLLDHDIWITHIQPDGSTVKGERIPRQLSLF